MNKTIASVLLFLIAWFSWPLWTALQIREAVLSGDTAVLERKVDWSGVRASLKQSLPVYLAGQGLSSATDFSNLRLASRHDDTSEEYSCSRSSPSCSQCFRTDT